MRPISLKIKGIKNYQTEQFIDFEALSSDGVFGICGKTGSGKSAIVESIIIALFGNLPSGKNDNYSVVNLTTKQAYIEFVFSLNKDGQERKYLIVRKLKTENENKMEAEIFDITDKKISLASGIRDVKNCVIDLLKLNEKDFTQCVILEQGQYDKFVTADASERKKMIGNIFSLNRYGEELNNKVLEYRQVYKAKVESIESVLNSIGPIDKKLVEDKKKDYIDLQKQLEDVSKQKERAAAYLSELEKLYDQYKKYLEFQEKLKIAQEQKSALEKKVQELSNDHAQKAEQAKQVKDLTLQKEELKSYIDSLNNNRSSQQKLKDLDAQRNEKVQEYKKVKAEINLLKDSLQKSRKTQEKILEVLNERLNELDKLFDIKLSLDDKLAVNFVDKFKEYDSNVQNYLKLSTELEKLNKEINENEKELQGLYSLQADIVIKSNEYKKILDELKKERERLAEQNAKAILRAKVKIGDPCPICASVIKELPEDTEIVNLEDINNQINDWEKAYYDINKTQAAQGERIFNLEKSVKEKQQKAEKLRQDLADLKLDDDCAKKKDKLTKIKDDCLNLIAQNDKIQKDIQEQSAKLEKNEALLQKIEEQGKSINAQIAELQDSLKKILGGYDSFEQALKDSREKYENLQAKIQDLTEAEKAAFQALNDTNAELIKTLTEIDSYKNSLSSLSSKEITQAQLDQAREEKSKLEETQNNLSQKLGELKSEIKRLEQDLQKADQAQKELSKAQKKLDLINQLHKLTSSNKLMEFMAEEYIEEFTYAASEHLNALTMGQFELIYQNGFWIKDHFCGGQIRKVNTVSGGEMFLVSLSLAISISRALSRRSGAAAVEFLFIDEGFGTLDSDLIDTVMDALEKLKDSFIIGLISHRVELQQRLPKKLYIQKTSKGSVISC